MYAGGHLAAVEELLAEGEAHREEAPVQLADGRARLGGREVAWRTAGVYRVAEGNQTVKYVCFRSGGGGPTTLDFANLKMKLVKLADQ